MSGWVRGRAGDVRAGTVIRDPLRDRPATVVACEPHGATVRFWTDAGRRLTFHWDDPVDVAPAPARQLPLATPGGAA